MKRVTLLLLAVLSGVLSTWAQQPVGILPGDQASVEVIKQLERAVWDSYKNNDATRLDRLFADNLTFTKENGFISTKDIELRTQKRHAEQRGAAAGAPLAEDDFTYEVQAVRVFGDAAVTTGYFQERDMKLGPVRFHFTNTWVKRDGQWQVVAIQITTASEPVVRKLAGLGKK